MLQSRFDVRCSPGCLLTSSPFTRVITTLPGASLSANKRSRGAGEETWRLRGETLSEK